MLIIQLVIIQMVTFALLIFVLRKIMYKASFRETARLQELNKENAEKARELAKKIEETEGECRKKISEAEAEVRQIKTQNEEDVEKLKEEVLHEAKKEAERLTQQALNSKERIRENIMSELRDKSVEQSFQLMQNVLGSKNQELLHQGFIESVLEDIAKIEKGKIDVKVEAGQLISAYKLDKNVGNKISSILSEKTGKKISLEEKVDKKTIAGVVIKLGSLIIDGSLMGRLKEEIEALKKG